MLLTCQLDYYRCNVRPEGSWFFRSTPKGKNAFSILVQSKDPQAPENKNSKEQSWCMEVLHCFVNKCCELKTNRYDKMVKPITLKYMYIYIFFFCANHINVPPYWVSSHKCLPIILIRGWDNQNNVYHSLFMIVLCQCCSRPTLPETFCSTVNGFFCLYFRQTRVLHDCDIGLCFWTNQFKVSSIKLIFLSKLANHKLSKTYHQSINKINSAKRQ